MQVASKVGNLPSKFGHARPSGSGIICYVRDGWMDRRTDKTPQTNTQGYHMGTIWALMWYPYGLAQQGAWCVCSRYSAGTYMGCTRWPTKNPDWYLVCLLVVFQWDLYGDMYCSPDILPFPPPSCTSILSMAGRRRERQYIWTTYGIIWNQKA